MFKKPGFWEPKPVRNNLTTDCSLYPLSSIYLNLLAFCDQATIDNVARFFNMPDLHCQEKYDDPVRTPRLPR